MTFIPFLGASLDSSRRARALQRGQRGSDPAALAFMALLLLLVAEVLAASDSLHVLIRDDGTASVDAVLELECEVRTVEAFLLASEQ